MSIHHITLIVDGPDLQDDTIIDRLFEAGCDDAAIGRSDEIQYIDFDREATSLGEAILSAVRDVEHVDGVSVVRVADAGLVSMTKIATASGPLVSARCNVVKREDTGTSEPVTR